jgi:hypothetical protein
MMMTDHYKQVCAIDGAIRNLKLVRDALAEAKAAPKLLRRIRSDLKSAEGARNHARGKWLREQWRKDATQPSHPA